MPCCQSDSWREEARNQVALAERDSFRLCDVVMSKDMFIVVTDEFNHCLWRLKGGPKGICPMEKISSGERGSQIFDGTAEKLSLSKWDHP